MNEESNKDKIPMSIDMQKFVVSQEFGLKMKVICKIWDHIQWMWLLTLIAILIIHFW